MRRSLDRELLEEDSLDSGFRIREQALVEHIGDLRLEAHEVSFAAHVFDGLIGQEQR